MDELLLDTGVAGDITVTRSDGQIRVQGAQVPTVELTNTGSERRPGVPIGTRAADDLVLTVDGRTCPVWPGPGKYRRGTYRVLVETPAGQLLFTPSNADSHRLVRGDRSRPAAELGFFTRHPDSVVTVEWSVELALTPQPLRPEPADVAIGYVLASGFGTGAQFFFAALLSSFDQVVGN